jgi:hypothetical protein
MKMALFSTLRGKENGHAAAFHFGFLLQDGGVARLLGKAQKQIASDLGVRHLAAAETHGDLDTVSVREKLQGIFELGIEVADVNAGRHTHFLDLDDMLILAGLLLTLALLETELAVVHELANRRIDLRRDLHKIETVFVGNLERLRGGHDAELLTRSADQANLAVANFFVELMCIAANTEAPPSMDLKNKKTSAITHPQ